MDAFNGLCTGCGYCLPCPNDIDTAKLMDVYNIAILSDSFESAKGRLNFHWFNSAGNPEACSLCGLCESRCTQHLPIRNRLQELVEQFKE
jgi:predicted aldo/keto reductase-like oxidoreductase